MAACIAKYFVLREESYSTKCEQNCAYVLSDLLFCIYLMAIVLLLTLSGIKGTFFKTKFTTKSNRSTYAPSRLGKTTLFHLKCKRLWKDCDRVWKITLHVYIIYYIELYNSKFNSQVYNRLAMHTSDAEYLWPTT